MKNFDFCVRSACIALVSVLSVCIGASPALADTIVLSWNPNPEPDVTGYMLHVGTQSGWYTQTVDTGMTTSYTWWGATAGQRYCFALSAYIAGYLEGPKSGEVCGYSNQYPVLTNPGARSSTRGQPTDLQLQGSDPDGRPVSYSATGLPAGLALMSSTGYISGTPTNSGNYNVTVTVSDGVLTSSQAFTWTITESGTSSGSTSGGSSVVSNGTGLRGDYFSGRAFDSLLSTRTEAVDFNWGSEPPVWNVPADNFSVRWTGEIVAPATGTYYFSTVSDDGVRVWVSDQLLIDQWSDHGAKLDTSGGTWLQAGQKYAIKLEFYEAGGAAIVQLLWEYPGQSIQVIPQAMLFPSGGSSTSGGSTSSSSGSTSGLRGYYYSGLYAAVLTSRVEAVNFDWGYGAPAPEVPADNFSVEWNGEIIAPATGTYYFSTVSDDGVLVIVGNELLIANWTNHAAATDTSYGIWLQAGQSYPIRVNYFDGGGGAVIQLRWSYPGQSTQVVPQSALRSPGSDSSNTVPATPTGTGLTGNYYDGRFESFRASRVEAVDFTWYDAPAPDVPADSFSVQWTGQLVAPVTGTYTFATVSDDGVRLWVDNQWLIDNWTDHPTVTDTSRGVYLEAGQKYPVRLDFYENGGVAVMQLLWAIPGRGYEVIPQSALTP